MAIYDIDATATTAVTAWLAQHKVAATGAITDVSTTDTFHVYWIHRSLQKIAYDLAISGDDEINLSYPNPSKSEAIGTIITLNDHTTDYSINYTVTDTVMESHFGGSVSQNGGDDIYSGIQILGKTDGTVPINVLQNHTVLTSHWGNGKNQTDSNTLARLCIKTRVGGVTTDNNLVHVRLNKWLYPYATWGTTLGLGEKVASVSAESQDPQNTTALITTVRAYDVTNTDGYNLIDLDGNGTKPYIGKWNWGTQATKKSIYEFVKAILAEDSTDTLYGVTGTLWTGRLYDCVITPGTGTWVQSETLSWTGGTGNLVAVDDLTATGTTRLVLHLNTGVFPDDTVVITGSGTASPIGTLGNPSNNWTDTVAIQAKINAKKITLQGLLTLGLGDDANYKTIVGMNPLRDTLVVEDASDTLGLIADNLTFSGHLDGGSILQDCVLGEVRYFSGYVNHCAFTSNTIFVNGIGIFVDTRNGATCIAPPVIDLLNATGLGVRGHIGDLIITNKVGTGGCKIQLDGELIIDATCTTGSITVYGDGYVTNNSTGTFELIDRTTGSPAEIAQATIDAGVATKSDVFNASQI